MSKTFIQIYNLAYQKSQKLTKPIKEKLEKTNYNIILNHKQMIMIKKYIKDQDLEIMYEDESNLLNIIINAEEIINKQITDEDGN